MTSLYFTIPLVVYPFDVIVSIDQTDEELWRRLRRNNVTKEQAHELWNMDETVRGRAVLLPTNQVVIRLKMQPTRAANSSVIAHEVFHAASYILWRIGMKLEIGSSDEAYAYLIGFLVFEIERKIYVQK